MAFPLISSATHPLAPAANRYCPEDEAGVLSHLFYAYANGLVARGYKQALEPVDLWDVCRKDESGLVSAGFQKNMRGTADPVQAPQVRTR